MLLVVEDDPTFARAYARTLRRHHATTIVGDIAAARAALAASRSLCGLIVDYLLPDGTGLDFLREVRAAGIDAPALLISGNAGTEVLESCFTLNTHFLTKPFGADQLVTFATRAARATTKADIAPVEAELLAVAADWRARFRLTPAEHALLLATLKGETREAFGLRTGATFNTVRKHATHLLRKTGYGYLAHVARAVRAEGERGGVNSKPTL